MASYKSTSPYYNTDVTNGYLDVMAYRNIPAESDDILFEVTKSYEHRPDLLAFDLYSDVNLWWVFSVRNNSILKDPVYDLTAGTKIYLPKITTIKSALGI
jgi:hypothetical protein